MIFGRQDPTLRRRVQALEESVAELAHLKNVTPDTTTAWVDIQQGVGLSFGAPSEIPDFDRVVSVVAADILLGDVFDARIADYNGTPFVEGTPIWYMDLAGSKSLAISEYPALVVRAEDSEPVEVLAGPFWLSIIDNNMGNVLLDTSKWVKITGDPTAGVLEYVPEIVASAAVANGPLTLITNSAPTDFASKLIAKIVDVGGASSGTITFSGTDSGGAALIEALPFTLPGGAGTFTFTTTNEFKTVSSITISGLSGSSSGDTITITIELYPAGVLRSTGGDAYIQTNPAGSASGPPSADWVVIPVALTYMAGYLPSTNYLQGQYVREARPLFAGRSATGGGDAPAGSVETDPATGTAVGPDYIFKVGGDGITIDADGNTVTFTVPPPDTPPDGSINTTPTTATAGGPNYTFVAGTGITISAAGTSVTFTATAGAGTIVTTPTTATAVGPNYNFQTSGGGITISAAAGGAVTFTVPKGQIVTTPTTGTAAGPDYTFQTSGGGITITATGTTVTFTVPSTPSGQITTNPATGTATGPNYSFENAGGVLISAFGNKVLFGVDVGSIVTSAPVTGTAVGPNYVFKAGAGMTITIAGGIVLFAAAPAATADTVVKIQDGTPVGGLYDVIVMTRDTAAHTEVGGTPAWAYDLFGAPALPIGQFFNAIYRGVESGRPVYSIQAGLMSVVTSVTCVDGVLNVTNQDVIGMKGITIPPPV